MYLLKTCAAVKAERVEIVRRKCEVSCMITRFVDGKFEIVDGIYWSVVVRMGKRSRDIYIYIYCCKISLCVY